MVENMRFDINKKDGIIQVGKTIFGKYEIDYIIQLLHKYKYTYKATQNFFRCDFDGKYMMYILCNEDLDYLMDFLNQLKVIKIIAKAHSINRLKTLYKIKDKIELL